MTQDKPMPGLILERIEKLERHNRRLRIGLTLMVVCGAGAVFMAAKAADDNKTLEATRIIVRDQDGNIRVVLGQDTQNKARTGVFLYDQDGYACLNLHAADRQAGMAVEEGGKHRLSLGTGQKKFAGLLVLANPGQSEKGQMCLFYTDSGTPAFAMNDRNHKTRVMMMLDKEDRPYMMLQDENQKAFYSQGQRR